MAICISGFISMATLSGQGGAKEETEIQGVRLQTPETQLRSQHLPCSLLCLLHARIPTYPALRVVLFTVGDAERWVMCQGSLIPGGQPLTIPPQGQASVSKYLQTFCLSPASLRFRRTFLFQVSVGPQVGLESRPQPTW